MENKFVCCICNKTFTGYGNNPYPIKEEGECCDDCNIKVINIRIAQTERNKINGNKRL